MLEAIGAKQGSNHKSGLPGINYQDAINISLCKDADNDAATQEGYGDSVPNLDDPQAPIEYILPAVNKVHLFLLSYPFHPR